jgi:aminobenzoyl-glutamate utilization protein B
MKTSLVLSICALLFIQLGNAQKKVDDVLKKLDGQAESYGAIAQKIWDLAEMGYQEEKSSALLQQTLSDAGFSIKTGVAGIPTAFIAEYGAGAPVIGIMGEYDALPGLSQ